MSWQKYHPDVVGPCWFEKDFYNLDGSLASVGGCRTGDAPVCQARLPDGQAITALNCEIGARAGICEKVISGRSTVCVSHDKINELPCDAYSPLEHAHPTRQARCLARSKCVIKENKAAGALAQPDLSPSALLCVEDTFDCSLPQFQSNAMLCMFRGRRKTCVDPNDPSTCDNEPWCKPCAGKGYTAGCVAVNEQCDSAVDSCPAGQVQYSYNPNSCSDPQDPTLAIKAGSGETCADAGGVKGMWSHCRPQDKTKMFCDTNSWQWDENNVVDCASCAGVAHGTFVQQKQGGCTVDCMCQDGVLNCNDAAATCLGDKMCDAVGSLSDCELVQKADGSNYSWRRKCGAGFVWGQPGPFVNGLYGECCVPGDWSDCVDGTQSHCEANGDRDGGEYGAVTQSCGPSCLNGNTPVVCADLCASQQCMGVPGAVCEVDICNNCDVLWKGDDGSLLAPLTCINNDSECLAAGGRCVVTANRTADEQNYTIGNCSATESCIRAPPKDCPYNGGTVPHDSQMLMGQEGGSTDYCKTCICFDGLWDDCTDNVCLACAASSASGKGSFSWVPAGEFSECNADGWSRKCSAAGVVEDVFEECDVPCPAGQVRKTGYDPVCVDYCTGDQECGGIGFYCDGSVYIDAVTEVGWCVTVDERCNSAALDAAGYGPCVDNKKYICNLNNFVWEHKTYETCSTCNGAGSFSECDDQGRRAECIESVGNGIWGWSDLVADDMCDCHDDFGTTADGLEALPQEFRYSDCGGPAGSAITSQKRECFPTALGGTEWGDWVDRQECAGAVDACDGLDKSTCNGTKGCTYEKASKSCKSVKCEDLVKKDCESNGCWYIDDVRPVDSSPCPVAEPGCKICINPLGSVCDLYSSPDWSVNSKACDNHGSCKWEGSKKSGTCIPWMTSPHYISSVAPQCKESYIITDETTCCDVAAETNRQCANASPETVVDFDAKPKGCFYEDGTVFFNAPPAGSTWDDWSAGMTSDTGCHTLNGTATTYSDAVSGCICSAGQVDFDAYKSELKKMSKALKKLSKKDVKKGKKKWGKVMKKLLKTKPCKVADGNGETINDAVDSKSFAGMGAGLPQTLALWDTYCDCSTSKDVGKCESGHKSWEKAMNSYNEALELEKELTAAIAEREAMQDFLKENPFGGAQR